MLALCISGVTLFLVVPGSFPQQLSTSRHTQSQLTDADAKTILAQASSVLQTKDGPDDVACNVTLSLAGSVSTFDFPIPDELYTPADFEAVCSRPTYIHLVNAINNCGGLSMPGLAGCSETPGKCIVVVRLYDPTPLDKEGILWAHEYGHTKGLQHRNDERAIMNAYLGPTERCVNVAECEAFAGRGQQDGSSHPGPPKPSVVAFVHRTYPEGLPFEVASAYTRDDAKILIGLLDKPDEKPYLTNIVVTLGMIGDPIAVRPLSALVEAGEGAVDPQTLRVKTSALIALGYVVNKNKTESAFAYLVQGLNPKSWKDKNLKWTVGTKADANQRDISLMKASALGLGIAGTPDAEKALSSAQSTIESIYPTFSSAVKPVIQQSLAVNKTVQQQGLLKYQLQMQNE
jgi:hypothetical protein